MLDSDGVMVKRPGGGSDAAVEDSAELADFKVGELLGVNGCGIFGGSIVKRPGVGCDEVAGDWVWLDAVEPVTEASDNEIFGVL